MEADFSCQTGIPRLIMFVSQEQFVPLLCYFLTRDKVSAVVREGRESTGRVRETEETNVSKQKGVYFCKQFSFGELLKCVCSAFCKQH